MPPAREEQWVIEGVVREDELEVVSLGGGDELLERSQPWKATELGSFEAFNGAADEFGQAAS